MDSGCPGQGGDAVQGLGGRAQPVDMTDAASVLLGGAALQGPEAGAQLVYMTDAASVPSGVQGPGDQVMGESGAAAFGGRQRGGVRRGRQRGRGQQRTQPFICRLR